MLPENYDFKNDKLIKEYIETIRKEGSQATFTSHINSFFKTIGKTPEEFLKLDEMQIKRFIKAYIAKKSHNAPKTLQTALSTIRYFIEDKEIYFHERYWKNIRRRVKGGALTQTQYFNKNDIKILLQYSGIFERALILVALSSGLRLDTILKLKEQDIDFDSEPTEIYVHATITKNSKEHYTYLTKEATNALKLYLKEKDNYLQQAYKKTKKIPKPEDKILIFPYTDVTIRKRWYRILDKAGDKYNKRDIATDRYIVRFHNLKKYFKTQLFNADVNHKIIDYLSEHRNQLDEIYIDINANKEFIKEQYKKAEEKLSILETTIHTSEIKEEIRILKDENTKLKDQMTTLLDLQSHRHTSESSASDYHEIVQIKVNPDGDIKFIDFNKLEQIMYEIKNDERIKYLKDAYEDNIKKMLKEAKKINQPVTLSFV